MNRGPLVNLRPSCMVCTSYILSAVLYPSNSSLDAGVPVVPGYHGTNQDPDFLLERAKEIGRSIPHVYSLVLTSITI